MGKQPLILLLFVSATALSVYIVMQDKQLYMGEAAFIALLGAATVYAAYKYRVGENKLLCGVNILLGFIIFVPAFFLFAVQLLWTGMESTGGAWHL